MEPIARTLFLTSTSSFLVFLAADLLRPGFVSNYFSVHGVLLAAVCSGIWWSMSDKKPSERRVLQTIAAFGIGTAFAVITWRLGTGLGEYVFLVWLLAFFSPIILLALLRSSVSPYE